MEETEPKIDPREALAALGYPEVSDPVRITGGWETLLWRFQTPDGSEHSLRVYHLARIRAIAWRERAALEACAGAGLPAPRVEKAGEVCGYPALVLSWCPGVPILSFIEKKPWLLWRLSHLFGQMHARMHAIRPPGEFLASAPREWVMRAGDEYQDLVEHALGLGLRTDCLIHMDYHPLNIVSDGSVITGVLDWCGAAAGDPRADLARTEITLLAAPVPPGPMAPFLNLARHLVLRAWRSGYRSVAGSLPNYRPLRAWAGATLITEIVPVIDMPNVWGTRQDLEKFRRLVETWAREEGVRR